MSFSECVTAVQSSAKESRLKADFDAEDIPMLRAGPSPDLDSIQLHLVPRFR